jgi:VWFA-related protein
MTRITFIIFLTALMLLAASQTLLLSQVKPAAVEFYLNELDFSRYPLVDLYVTIVNTAGQPISLAPSDSQSLGVSQNDRSVSLVERQSVLKLKETGQSELYIALVFDNSSSMSERTKLLERAANQFIDSLKTGDNACIVDFGNEQSSIKIPEIDKSIHARQRIGFSNAKKFLKEKIPIQSLTARTYMFDALMLGLSALNTTSVLGRKAIILFSDGLENGSTSSLDDCSRFIDEYHIPVYAIDLNESVNSKLKNLAKISGGEYFFVKSVNDLSTLYQSVLKILKGQYRLTYRSPEQNVSSNMYAIKIAGTNRFTGSAARAYAIEGEKIAFANLSYLESQGKERVQDFLDFVSGFPSSKRIDKILVKIGRFWERRGEYANALAAYNIIVRNPQSTEYREALLQKANLLQSAKQFKSAQAAYTQVINTEQNPTIRAQAMLELAKTYSAEGNFALALNTYSALTSQYGGTEYASEAHLRAGSLSMEMGNLPAAEQNFLQIIETYGESKSASYARFELAKVLEKNKSYKDADQNYQAVINAPVDPDMKEQAQIGRARNAIAAGNSARAIQLYNEILNSPVSKTSQSGARLAMVPLLMKSGNIVEARHLFESMPPEEQEQLRKSNPTVPIDGNGIHAIGLISGAYVTTLSQPHSPKPISVIKFDEAIKKFSAIGPIYNIAQPPTTLRASIPVQSEWVSNKLIVDGTSGVFRFSEGTWMPLTLFLDTSRTGYMFAFKEGGTYAILARTPRIFRLTNIYFELGKADIRQEDERPLFEIIDDLRAAPDARLEIGGHTDSTGTDEENIELSQRRANAVKAFMVRYDIEASRLTAKGYGRHLPIVANDSPENMQKNRRTEFTIIRPIVDPSKRDSIEKLTYYVQLGLYRNAKDLYDNKRLYQAQGFIIIVLAREDEQALYELSLGTFDSHTEATTAVESFKRVFKNVDPKILITKKLY